MAAVLHDSAPLARVLGFRAAATVASPTPVRLVQSESRILLGLSEPELRQLALEFGQVR